MEADDHDKGDDIQASILLLSSETLCCTECMYCSKCYSKCASRGRQSLSKCVTLLRQILKQRNNAALIICPESGNRILL